MGLIKCSDCAAEISTEARTCPKCGKPRARTFEAGPVIGVCVAVGLVALYVWRVYFY